MAYDTQKLKLLCAGIGGGENPVMWTYEAGDDTVTGNNYISDAAERGMKDGDIVMNVTASAIVPYRVVVTGTTYKLSNT